MTPNGTRLSFTILTISGITEFERSAELVASQLKKVGIEAKVVAQALGTVDQLEGVGDFHIGFMGLGMSITTDLDWYLYERFHSSQAPPIGDYAPRNWARYRNPDMDRLLDLQRTTMDPKVRREIIYEIQNLIAKDLPVLTLYVKYSLTAYRTDRFAGWNETEGPTSKVSLIVVSLKKPLIITETAIKVLTQVQTIVGTQTIQTMVPTTIVVVSTPTVATSPAGGAELVFNSPVTLAIVIIAGIILIMIMSRRRVPSP